MRSREASRSAPSTMRLSADQRRGERAVLKEYARLADRYDRRWSFYVEATVRETLSRLSLEAEGDLLDIGCGTGALLLAVSQAQPAARLVGIDASPEMLTVARQRLGTAARLEQAWAHALPFDDGSFDIVVSSSVFHFLREPLAALAEMRRVLRAGGRLVITDWCHDYISCRICDFFLRRISRAHYRVYRRRECQDLLKASAFTDVAVERYKINWLWGMMTATARHPAS